MELDHHFPCSSRTSIWKSLMVVDLAMKMETHGVQDWALERDVCSENGSSWRWVWG